MLVWGFLRLTPVNTHTLILTNMYTYVHTHIAYVCSYTCKFIEFTYNICVHVCVYICECVYTHMYVGMYYVPTFVCTYTYTNVSICKSLLCKYNLSEATRSIRMKCFPECVTKIFFLKNIICPSPTYSRWAWRQSFQYLFPNIFRLIFTPLIT